MNSSKKLLYFVSLTILFAACGGGSSPTAPLAPSLSNDSGVTGIVLSNVALDQIFQTNLLNYTATVPPIDSTTTVTARLSDANATMTVNGIAVASGEESGKISLHQGSNNTNIITVIVTAEDGVTTTTYTIAVTRLTADSFAQQAYIKASNTDSEDHFGESLALDGDTLAVGAFGEDSSATGVDGDQADNSAGISGAAYVFARDASDVWSQQAYIKASNTDEGDFFGVSVALDGDTLVVGAQNEESSATGVDGDQSDNSADGSGAIYVFKRDASDVWSQQAYIKASNTNLGDSFGDSIALDGDTLAVGASGEESSATGIDGDQSDNSAGNAGAVYVFVRDAGEVWSQQAYIKASNTATHGRSSETDTDDRFGVSVALDGDTLAVGAYGEASSATGIDGDQSSNSAGNAGAVYVFARDASDVWTQQAYVKASNTDSDDRFGISVALDGDTLAVGAPGEASSATGIDGDQSDNSDFNFGAVYVFVRDASEVWSQQAYIKASNANAGDGFGRSVALDGDTLAVGAFGEDSSATGVDGDQADNSVHHSGAVYVFTRDASDVWSQQAYIKASNTDSNDNFGSPVVALDGDTLAVGASSEDSNANGVEGDQADNSAANSGAVYVFE